MGINHRIELLVILQYTVMCCTGEKMYSKYGRMHNHTLQHVITSTDALTGIACCRACNLDESCVAVNYERSTGKCELSDQHPMMEGAVIQAASFPQNDIFFLTSGCRTPWSAFRGHCYLFNPTTLSWSDAETNCVSLGGHLADVMDGEENEFVGQFMIYEIWLGITDLWNVQPQSWVTGAPLDYENFNPGEPNNSGDIEGCVEMRNDKFWNDNDCSLAKESICKKPCYIM